MDDFDRVEEARERNEGLYYEEHQKRLGSSDVEPVPVCSQCGGSVRQDLRTSRAQWLCDLHGPVIPEWVYPEEEPDG